MPPEVASFVLRSFWAVVFFTLLLLRVFSVHIG